MLLRVIRWRGWASLIFRWAGHFEENDHHIEEFEKFDNSIDFPIIFPYTYGYAGAACLTPRGWGPFFESKKYPRLSDTWMSKFHQNMNFHESQVWPYQNDREASGIIFLGGPSFWEIPEVTRRAYMPRMSMLARVIRRPGWASLNFCSDGHVVWNDHHIEKFEKFDNSIDFPIVFPDTYGYAGAACLNARCWGPFFESKKHRALRDTWVSKIHQNMNFHESQVWPYQNNPRSKIARFEL